MIDTNQDIQYELIENEIHILTFIKPNRPACDVFVARYSEIILAHKGPEALKLVIDVRQSGVPPIKYLFGRVRGFYAEISREQIPNQIYAAYLHDDSVMLKIAQAFLELLNLPAKRRFFSGEAAYDEALAWIAALDEKTSASSLTS